MELEFNSPFDILYQNEPNGEFSYIGILNKVFNDDYLDFLYNWLEKTDDFKTGHTSFGAIPRLQKWYQRDKHYFSYKWKDQNLDRWKSNDYDSVLDDLEIYVQNIIRKFKLNEKNINFPLLNSCLINKYRDGSDSIKPHRDNKDSFGENPTVIGISLGVEREIIFKRIEYNPNKMNSIKLDKDRMEEIRVPLKPGSLFIMGGAVQKYYSHEIPKDDSENVRYSLTFREYIKN
tara:strand:+ start:374 stop:1069 length:696 start_codon:yes stop_codon:yes gene_type:complete